MGYTTASKMVALVTDAIFESEIFPGNVGYSLLEEGF